MKKTKKIIALAMAFSMMFGVFAGCGDSSADENTDTAETQSADETTPGNSETTSCETSTDTTAETSEKSETSAEKTPDDEFDSSDSEDIDFSFECSNSWPENNVQIYQLDGSVTNNQKASITQWCVTLEVSEDAEVKNSWGCSISIDSGKMTITPDNNTAPILANGNANFGMQIASSVKIDTDSAEFTSKSSETAANPNGNNNNNNNGSNNNSGQITSPSKDVPAPTTDDWLSTDGNKIVDSEGNEVWLTGCNWFGYNTGTNCFDGLWACDLNTSIAEIANHGFNLLRIPISTELVNNWQDGTYPQANFNNALNSYLLDMNSLEIFDYVIGQCRANGIKIMIDFHCAETNAMGHIENMWVSGDITEKDYYRALSWIAERYKDDDTIIAIDLENEPHGKHNESPRAKWDDSSDSDNWRYIAEQAADAVLSENPNLLVMVEGIEIYPVDIKKNGDFSSTNEDDYYFNWWGGNLRGVADNPVDLGKHQDKLVYSPHDYGPTVFEQPWFEGDISFDSLMSDCWQDNWFYIYDEDIAPLLIGEWGSKLQDEKDIEWITCLRQLISENKLNHTFWCFNQNSGDTNGLILDDWTTWDENKYEFVKEVLWQDKDGKFIGLDHEIPLGENGISLSEYAD